MKHYKFACLLLILIFIFNNKIFGQITDHAPAFTGGHTQFLTICENTSPVSVDTLLAIIDSDSGDTETWATVSAPSQGTLLASYTTLSTGGVISPVGLSYTPNPGYSGADSFRVSIFDGFEADTTTIYVTITPTTAGSITGILGTCIGDTTSLGNSVAGGIWSSANTSVATIDPETGIIKGVSGGTSVISYSVTNACGTANTSVSFTVNTAPPPFPVGITGFHAVCIGAVTTVNDATAGGKWLSSDQSIASIDSVLGTITGVSAGLAAVTYAEVNFCANYYRVITVTVDPLPTAVTGSFSLCTGVSSTLHDSLAGGSWSSSATGVASVGPYTGVVTGYSSGTAVITYSVGIASCKTTALVTVSITPSAFNVTGGGAYCAGGPGSDIGLSGSAAGVRYQLYRSGAPTTTFAAGTGFALDFGLQTLSGSYTIVATDTLTGCTKNMFGVAAISINGLPTVFTVSGGGTYCAGGSGYHIYLAASQTGIHYQLYSGITSVGAPVAGTGGALDFGLYAAAGTYTVIAANTLTGCTRTMAGSATITVGAHPVAFSIIGGGNYCAGGTGVHIGLDSSAIGVNYQLLNGVAPFGAPAPGTGIPLDLGLVAAAGVYTVLGTNATTGCTTLMPGSTTIVINPLPLTYLVTGGGSYCIGGMGRHISLPNSQTGISYQLYNGATPSGPADTGTGFAIDLGLQTIPGVYTIVATNTTTDCSNTMTGSTSITIDSLPSAHTVTGGGSYCVGDYGVYIQLDGSDAGVDYQLFDGADSSGLPESGSGGPIDLGLETVAGTYTVIAVDITTGCSDTMAGSATVIVNPVPAPITGIDSVYVGATTTLSDLTPGGTWSSENNDLATVGITGVVYGDTVGRDTIVYTLPTGCTAKVEVTVNYAPIDTSHTMVSHYSSGPAGITVFPNPSAGNINIKWAGFTAGTAGIVITDVAGRVVYRSSIYIDEPSGQAQIKPDLSDGAYLLTIRSETACFTAVLLIRR